MRSRRIETNKEIRMRMKVSMVFWCAKLMKRDIGYKEACRVADEFSIEELDRIYKELKRRT